MMPGWTVKRSFSDRWFNLRFAFWLRCLTINDRLGCQRRLNDFILSRLNGKVIKADERDARRAQVWQDTDPETGEVSENAYHGATAGWDYEGADLLKCPHGFIVTGHAICPTCALEEHHHAEVE